MIELKDTKPLGVGRHRACYQHPDDENRCIKIVHSMETGGDKELQRELDYYKHLQGYLKDWRGLPRYYGTVQTDLGTGYVYDIIRDYDGSPSKTLTQMFSNDISEEYQAPLQEALKGLQQYLYDNRVVTMNIKPYNVLWHRLSEDKVELVICDNIGEASFIPLATHFAMFAHSKQRRQWTRFMDWPLFKKLRNK